MAAVAHNFDHIASTEALHGHGEKSKATMHLGVAWKGNADPYEDKRDPVVWPMNMDVARVIVRREEGKQRGREKKRTRGVNNKRHIAMKQGRMGPKAKA